MATVQLEYPDHKLNSEDRLDQIEDSLAMKFEAIEHGEFPQFTDTSLEARACITENCSVPILKPRGS